jgi:integrase
VPHARPEQTWRAQPRLQRESPAPFVFVSERGSPFTTAGLARMRRRGLELKAHPHMLRHACGYALANRAATSGRSGPDDCLHCRDAGAEA